MATLQEKQDLIDAEDWIGLSQTDVLIDFDYRSTAWEQYTLSERFLLNFIASPTTFSDALETAKAVNSGIYLDDVFIHVNERIKKQKIRMDAEKWGKYVNGLVTLAETSIIDNSGFGPAVQIYGKGPEYFGILLDDNLYERILRNSAPSSYRKSYITPDVFSVAQTDEEKFKIATRLTMNGSYSISWVNCDSSILGEAFGTDYDKGMEIAKANTLRPGAVFANLDSDEFGAVFEKYIDSVPEDKTVRVGGWTGYYEKNGENATISDSLIEKIRDRTSKLGTFDDIIHSMTMDQVVKYGNDINANVMIKKKEITLDKLTQLKGKITFYNLANSRFFTEEEIARNPHFFDPKYLQENPCLYVSKETFSLINRAQGRRFRYNDDLTKFGKIIDHIHYSNLTIPAIRYLQKRTGVSDEQMSRKLNTKYIPDGVTGDVVKVKNILEFIKIYSPE